MSAETSYTVEIDPTDIEASLEFVLDRIVFVNEEVKKKLVRYEINIATAEATLYCEPF